ncbi:MAG: RHS repeat protein [Chloroflexi bacterium]|nr:RHS repeat protein [Chloroflexota bacterium]
MNVYYEEGERPFCPQFTKFSQIVGWERSFCPQLTKFIQVVGWERPYRLTAVFFVVRARPFADFCRFGLGVGGECGGTAVGTNDMGQLKRLALNNGLTTWHGYLGYSASGNNDAYDATWGQFGKLWRICTAPHASNRCTYTNRNTAPLEQRLDLRYVYDDVGNLTTILDKMNSDQVQTFGYDHLNRLTSSDQRRRRRPVHPHLRLQHPG